MSVSNPGVNYSAILPLSWRNAEQVTAAVLEQWMGGNITLLRAFETMDSISIEHHPELRINDAKALERLESKVDLALGLLTQLLAKDLPQPISCTLSASGIEWLEQTAPALGSEIILSLYLNPKLPQALILPATVTHLTQSADGVLINATFEHLNEDMRDSLERTIFRYHRRAILAAHRTEH